MSWRRSGPTPSTAPWREGYTAHPKRDPDTGELHAVSYLWAWDHVRYTVVDVDGRVRREVHVPVVGGPDGPRLRHHREPRRPLRPAGDLRPGRGHGRAPGSPTPGTLTTGPGSACCPARARPRPSSGSTSASATSSTRSTPTRPRPARSWSTSSATRRCSTRTGGGPTEGPPASIAGPSIPRRARSSRRPSTTPASSSPARRTPPRSSLPLRVRHGGRRAVRPRRGGQVRPRHRHHRAPRLRSRTDDPGACVRAAVGRRREDEGWILSYVYDATTDTQRRGHPGRRRLHR